MWKIQHPLIARSGLGPNVKSSNYERETAYLATDVEKMGEGAGHSKLGWDNQNGSFSCEGS